MQENAARLKAYKAKLVIFPKRSNKPKSGDSSAEELKAVPQFKGTLLPLVHEKPQLETVKLTDEHKVRKLALDSVPHQMCNGKGGSRALRGAVRASTWVAAIQR